MESSTDDIGWIYKGHPSIFCRTLGRDKIVTELQNQWLHHEDEWGIPEEENEEWSKELMEDDMPNVNIRISVQRLPSLQRPIATVLMITCANKYLRAI